MKHPNNPSLLSFPHEGMWIHITWDSASGTGTDQHGEQYIFHNNRIMDVGRVIQLRPDKMQLRYIHGQTSYFL